MVSKLTKKPENSSTGMAVTGPTKVATCKDVDAAPISSPSDCATSDVSVPKARKRMKRTASEGCDVIQYTILQYATGNTICQAKKKKKRFLLSTQIANQISNNQIFNPNIGL